MSISRVMGGNVAAGMSVVSDIATADIANSAFCD